MAKLSAKQESFVRLMSENEELAHRGFQLLLKRPDYREFFDALKSAGLFDPGRNPAPVPAEQEGYLLIRYWSALDYLAAIAKISGESNDLELANKVMAVVREVAGWRDSDGQPRQNYHTARKFAEIFGLVPTASVTVGDLEFIPSWLTSRFDRMLVANALDSGAIPRFLGSSSPDDRDKAVLVLRYCTAIEWRKASGLGDEQTEPVTAVDDFSLTELIRHHARAFGERTGRKAAQVFLERVREVFGVGTRKLHSHMYRPAIEDHPQNHAWRGPENRSIEGLRDVLLSWCALDPPAAKPFVEQLLTDELEILRRVGIYVLGVEWEALRDLYSRFLAPSLFSWGHLHELHDLLRAHFGEFTDSERGGTLEAIRSIPQPTRGDAPLRLLKRIQLRWLSAITNKGYAPADEWFARLLAEEPTAEVSTHPEFHSYIERTVGPGASPYSIAELLAFVEEHTAVEKLNAFEERDLWRGPTLDGLTTALEEAVASVPKPFLQILPDFLRAKRCFQHSLISGIKKAWEATDRTKETDWDEGWKNIVAFFERLILDNEFWQEESGEDSRRDWVVSAVADCLHAGTQKDERAYSAELLPRTQKLVATLLEKTKGAGALSDDAMSQAINTPKGRAVEALFSHSLRACRVSDKATGSHEEVWNSARVIFEGELAKCRNANYEFSTLCGAYIAQLDYMSPEWVRTQMLEIFPTEFRLNSLAAMAGLGYATFSRRVYSLLLDSGVVDRALSYPSEGFHGRGRLLERVGAAYLWGDEALESPRFSCIFQSASVEDLETLTRVFWSVQGEISKQQKQRILDYWSRCIAWSRAQSKSSTKLLSALSMLSRFVTTADGQERELLEAVAPYGHYEFVDDLLRIVDKSPDGVSLVVGAMVKTRVPDYDYKDQLKKLLRALASKGKRVEVLSYAERLQHLTGIQELYDELTRQV
jgi:hypothetical protein